MGHLREHPPGGALSLLALFLPEQERDPVLGDLLEDYEAHPSAVRLWGQVLRSLAYFAWLGIRRAPWRTVAAMLAGYVLMAVGLVASLSTCQWLGVPLSSRILLAVELGGGLLFAAIGGYSAARISRGSGINGMVALCAFTLLMGVLSLGTEPWRKELMLMSVFALGVLLGGYARARQLAV